MSSPMLRVEEGGTVNGVLDGLWSVYASSPLQWPTPAAPQRWSADWQRDAPSQVESMDVRLRLL